MPKMLTTLNDQTIEKLRNLTKGDHLFTLEIEHDGDKDTDTVKIRDLVFQEYEDKKSNIESINKWEIGDPIMATLLDERFPKTPLKNNDISIGYFLTPVASVEASINLFERLLTVLKDKEWELKTKI